MPREFTDQPMRQRNPLIAFISARAAAEKKLRAKPDHCVTDGATFEALMKACDKGDVSIHDNAVVRGVSVFVGRQKPGRKVWSFTFVAKEGGAPQHDPVAAARWRRSRGVASANGR